MEAFYQSVSSFIPTERIFLDATRRLAWGTDAGFYRLIPEMVVFPQNEEEVSRLLARANETGTAVTFRAAGTSLSGQSISNSVLIVAGNRWEKYSVMEDGALISMQPGLRGGRVNGILKKYGRRLPPDPASVQAAMVGGIIVNNASGMNCGTHANSDRVIVSARIIFADGTVLDTGSELSRRRFTSRHSRLLREIERIRDTVRANPELVDQIERKYRIKNVTGLNLLPLIRFNDPFEILTHLMVGSEGTLGFLAEATMRTEVDLPYKASAMIYFSDIKTACQAVQVIKPTPVVGAEMLDRKALRSVEGQPGMPDYLASLPEEATALLVETRAESAQILQQKMESVVDALAASRIPTLFPVEFTTDESVYSVWWAIRSGIFPSVGGMRTPGTTCLIEDVAFPLNVLPEATSELQQLIARYGYEDGVIYGHALEGNFHFILNQSFDSPEEVKRYENLMRDVVTLVVDRYDGSLKAEHGTGRNMAPFVAKEWGEEAFQVMKRIKKLLDPNNILNPGVIFNDDPDCFIKGFKPLPFTSPTVDRCIECGFCEPNCLTWGLTLSSRQRIVIQREISRLEKSGEEPERLAELKKGYRYAGNMTCAGDGLCSTSCPMKINVGDLTHEVREKNAPSGSMVWRIGNFAANHLSLIETGLRPVLSLADLGHTVLGTSLMTGITGGLHKAGVPLWVPAMPKAHRVRKNRPDSLKSNEKVVYFPSCINQTMGVAKNTPYPAPLSDKMTGLLEKAGYEVIYPDGMSNLCCGTIWESKGMPDIADRKTRELEAALLKASQNGKYPVLCDQSPCLYRMRHEIKSLKLYEPVEFIETFLVDRLDFHPIDEPIAIHTTCSMTKMGLRDCLKRLAERCSTRVLIPEEVGCCGFAGDKGFTYPEVNKYALRKLRPQLEAAGVKVGYSNSRTCEIGLTTNGGIPYVSIVYLVDRCTTAKKPSETGQAKK